MARLLMNLLLMQRGYAHRDRLESRGDNLLALETADAGDLTDFVALAGETLLRSLEPTIKTARHVSLQEPEAFELQVLRLRKQLAPYDA